MGTRIQVKVESGILEGITCENENDSGKLYYNFQGIPYAKPPIGQLRFKAPQPVEPWEGVKDATKDGDQCYSEDQSSIKKKQNIGSENCLFLNVFSPKLPTKTPNGTYQYDLKPVMVNIHGGAFSTGSNSKSFRNPEYLIRDDVVLVTINYRLGLLGFLSLEDPTLGVPGNAGFKDTILALKWVQKNIKNFNGDPNNVTIFGESAGGAAVHLLVLSPLGKNLFHKAIIQSGSALCSWALSDRAAPLLAEYFGVEKGNEKKLLEKLKSVPVEELHEAQEKLPDPWDISKLRFLGYTIEKPNQKEEAFLTQDPLEIIRNGNYNHVPLFMGYTSREGMLFHFLHNKISIEKLYQDVQQILPHNLCITYDSMLSKRLAERVKKFYMGDQDFYKVDRDVHYKISSDTFFIRPVYESAIIHSLTSPKPVYLYEMNIETSINFLKKVAGITTSGVCHADDLAYLFNIPLNGKIIQNTPEDIGIRRFCKLWTNFAKYGNPNSKEKDPLLPVLWKPFKAEEKYYLNIDKELECLKDPLKDRMGLWDEVYSFSRVAHKI